MDAMTIEEALLTIKKYWQPKKISKNISIDKAVGYVSTKNMYSNITLPVQRSAKIDSVVVKSSDFLKGIPNTSEWVRGKDFDKADMGDDFSDLFDAAIPVEAVKFSDNGQKISFVKQVKMGIARKDFDFKDLKIEPGIGINKKGSVIQEGELIVKENTRILPTMIANLALGGHKKIEVFKKPKVAFIPTGSELIPIGDVPARGQTIDSNGIMMASFLKEWKAKPILFPIIKDQKEDLKKSLKKAMKQADIILINGGSSKGEEDYSAQLIRKNADFFQQHFLAVPGRPASVAVHGSKIIINVPGPPLATFGVSHWLVKPLIHHYYQDIFIPNKKVKVKLLNSKEDNLDVSVCVWFAIEKKQDEYVATAYFRDSQLSKVLSQVNAYSFLPAHKNSFKKGDYLEVTCIDS